MTFFGFSLIFLGGFSAALAIVSYIQRGANVYVLTVIATCCSIGGASIAAMR